MNIRLTHIQFPASWAFERICMAQTEAEAKAEAKMQSRTPNRRRNLWHGHQTATGDVSVCTLSELGLLPCDRFQTLPLLSPTSWPASSPASPPAIECDLAMEWRRTHFPNRNRTSTSTSTSTPELDGGSVGQVGCAVGKVSPGRRNCRKSFVLIDPMGQTLGKGIGTSIYQRQRRHPTPDNRYHWFEGVLLPLNLLNLSIKYLHSQGFVREILVTFTKGLRYHWEIYLLLKTLKTHSGRFL